MLVLLEAKLAVANEDFHRVAQHCEAGMVAGVATFPEDGDSFQALLTMAKARVQSVAAA